MNDPPMKPAPAVVVRIPGLLRSYTGGVDTVRLAGLPSRATLDDALWVVRNGKVTGPGDQADCE